MNVLIIRQAKFGKLLAQNRPAQNNTILSSTRFFLQYKTICLRDRKKCTYFMLTRSRTIKSYINWNINSLARLRWYDEFVCKLQIRKADGTCPFSFHRLRRGNQSFLLNISAHMPTMGEPRSSLCLGRTLFLLFLLFLTFKSDCLDP